MRLYLLGIHLAALGSKKARLWVSGRRNWRNKLEAKLDPNRPVILVHASSLGEMEQGLPILQNLRSQLKEHQIVLSFFSPSGYENFSGTELCDVKCYLPIDLPGAAQDFARIVNPDLALFVKYDIWPNHLKALEKLNSILILAPAVFRDNQIYFKRLGATFFRNALHRFHQIFVQNQDSLELLAKIDYQKATLCGDSRFDRAMDNTHKAFSLPIAQSFFDDKICLVAGSTWPKEEELIESLFQARKNLCLIIAPHDVNEANLKRIAKMFSKWGLLRLSQLPQEHQAEKVILVDGIGQLKFLYRYADLALIGGGFGKGIHSTVEAAAYRTPLLFGPNHHKFMEAQELLENGFAIELDARRRLSDSIDELLKLKSAADFETRYKGYLEEKTGASQKIANSIKELLIEGSHG